jgi:endonuclease/exonuclease/phosphatase family metal-dependent hydrolase
MPVMKLRSLLLVVALVVLLGVLAEAVRADTLRVVTYNSLNFNGQPSAARLPYYRTTMRAINPDIVILQEITGRTTQQVQDNSDLLLSSVFLELNDDWTAVPFLLGPDTQNLCFYRNTKVASVSRRAIPTELRDIDEFVFRPAVNDTAARLHVFEAHLKASDTDDDAAQRGREATVLRNELELLPTGSNFIVCGDFNLYHETEAAYTVMLATTPSTNGQLFDPINQFGDWHDHAAYAPYHTQSTRAAALPDGGASGGCDDRFDFILASGALMDTTDSYVISSTYKAFGNDGAHFNSAINAPPTNTAVPDSVANALYHGSDHLPVTVDIVLRGSTAAVHDRPATPASIELLECYPNPFNPSLSVRIAPLNEAATINVFDLLGRRMTSTDLHPNAAGQIVQIDFSKFGTGSYFVRLETPTRGVVRKVSYVR